MHPYEIHAELRGGRERTFPTPIPAADAPSRAGRRWRRSELSKGIGTTQKTAWFIIVGRLRKARSTDLDGDKLSGIVQIEATARSTIWIA